ncbi:MAG: hypothetical protein JEZ00_09480 [Anaerolineaceae bacterium]|nr:hypothetical protein [Anaerolineaceae bacterium]
MINRVKRFFGYRIYRQQQNKRIRTLSDAINRAAPQIEGEAPVLIFNASTRIIGLSQNAAFSLLSNWALKLQGVPTIQLVCRAGMQPCVLGTELSNPAKKPPCEKCMKLSDSVYANNSVINLQPEPIDLPELQDQSIEALAQFSHQGFPAGEIVLPSLRWILRRHHLSDNENTRDLFKRYIQSAVSFYGKFEEILEKEKPQAVLVFNGMFFPEATLKWAARKRDIKVISHEVALRPMTAFFTPGEATAYPIDLSEERELTEEQDAQLDAYLADRMKGDFSMAGIRFWPEMKGLDEVLLQRFTQYVGVIPVFTNVIFDTSQGHANVLFSTMFEWLDSVADLIHNYPDHLFIIRAHPDEVRPGKASQESVAAWFADRHLDDLPNVLFVPAEETFSSYEMIQRAKFVMVYNSTIGLEASIVGAAVVCAGKARFTQIESVYFPKNRMAYDEFVQSLLSMEEVTPPQSHQKNARKFLYVQLFETSLPMDAFLENDPYLAGYTGIKELSVEDLTDNHAEVLDIITNGILEGKPFLWQK